MLEALDVRLSLVACALRSRPLALFSARSLYSSALHSVFQFLSHFAYRTRFCQFWLSRLCVSTATPLRLVCCAFAPLLFSLLCLVLLSALLCSRLCSALLVSALLISSLLCSVSASRSVPKTSTLAQSQLNLRRHPQLDSTCGYDCKLRLNSATVSALLLVSYFDIIQYAFILLGLGPSSQSPSYHESLDPSTKQPS